MVLVPEFPRRLLREQSHSWNLLGVAATPGVTMDSTATYVRTDGGGFWACSMSDVSLSGSGALRGKERQKISTLLWRAVRQVCDGCVNKIVVPRNDALFRPWPRGLAHTFGLEGPHSDESMFDDDAGYYQSVIDIVCDGAAALRATSMDIAINYAGDLVGGESFSIDHPVSGWRLYEIATVVYSDDDRATITFNPPLREAIEADDALEFDRPRCTMRLATPSAMDLSVRPWTFNTASVDFLEAPVS